MTLKRRLLRTGTHRARTMHRCDTCDELIFPTDLYSLIVELHMIGDYTYLWIRKEHEHPCCQFPGDDPYERTIFESNVLEFKIAA